MCLSSRRPEDDPESRSEDELHIHQNRRKISKSHHPFLYLMCSIAHSRLVIIFISIRVRKSHYRYFRRPRRERFRSRRVYLNCVDVMFRELRLSVSQYLKMRLIFLLWIKKEEWWCGVWQTRLPLRDEDSYSRRRVALLDGGPTIRC